MKLVIDASVAVKWIVEEPGRDLARALLQRVASLHAPDFVVVEVGSALSKKARSGQITREQAILGLASLNRYFERLSPCGKLAERALELALSLDHSIYDCLYLACAESLDSVPVTSDERFIRKARKALASDVKVEIVPLTTSATLYGAP